MHLRVIAILLALLIEQKTATVFAQSNPCVISLNKLDGLQIPISIGYGGQNVIPHSTLAMFVGVFVPCMFTADSTNGIRAIVREFTLKIIRNGQTVDSLRSFGPLFSRAMKDAISNLSNNDVLTILDALVRIPNPTLGRDTNLKAASLEYIVHRTSKQKISKEDLAVMDVIRQTKEWKELSGKYASDAAIGRSVTFVHYQDKEVVRLTYNFYNNASLDYSFQYKYYRQTEKFSIWDNIKKRYLSVKQWKQIARESY